MRAVSAADRHARGIAGSLARSCKLDGPTTKDDARLREWEMLLLLVAIVLVSIVLVAIVLVVVVIVGGGGGDRGRGGAIRE